MYRSELNPTSAKHHIYNLLEMNDSDWVDEDGCYNSTIFKNTEQFRNYTEASIYLASVIHLY